MLQQKSETRVRGSSKKTIYLPISFRRKSCVEVTDREDLPDCLPRVAPAAVIPARRKWLEGVQQRLLEPLESWLANSRLVWVLCLAVSMLAAITAGRFFWLATTQGLGLSGDSVDYVASARNLEIGRGLYTLDGKRKLTPLRQFPPGYPALLTWFQPVDGRDVIARSRWIHAALHVGIVLLTGLFCLQVTGSSICGAVASLLLAVTQPLLMASTMLLSEAMYISLVLLSMMALARCLTSSRPLTFACVSGLLFAAASLTRYVGYVLAVVGVISILLWLPLRLKNRVTCAGALALCAAIPPLLWSLQLARIVGRASPRAFMFHPPRLDEAVEFFQTLGAWVLPRALPQLPIAGAALMIVFAVGIWMTHRKLCRRGTNDTARNAMLLACLLFVVLHPLFLLFCRTFLDANIRPRDRLLSPVFPVVLTLVITGITVLLRSSQWRVLLGAAMVVAAVACYAPRTHGWVERARERGQGYATRKWRESPTLKLVASAPPSHVIYSNGYDVIYLLTGRRVYQLPRVYVPSQDRPSSGVDEVIGRMVERVRDADGWLVYFNNVGREKYLAQEDRIRTQAELARLRRKQLNDGRVYKVVVHSAG